MATQEQIDTAIEAAQTYSTAKAAFEAAQGELSRAQAAFDQANALIEALASEGGATPEFWSALVTGLANLQAERSARTDPFLQAQTAMTIAKSDLDAAIAALAPPQLPLAAAALERAAVPRLVETEETENPEADRPTEHKSSHHHKSTPRKGK